MAGDDMLRLSRNDLITIYTALGSAPADKVEHIRAAILAAICQPEPPAVPTHPGAFPPEMRQPPGYASPLPMAVPAQETGQ
jgi:hypothetical protein